jgi:hypothetical protein
MAKLTKWDKEIMLSLERGKGGIKSGYRYKELRKQGFGAEETLDKMSGGTADTRWIHWLPHGEYGKKKLKRLS